MSFDRQLNSTSGLVVNLGLSIRSIFCEFKTRRFSTHFSVASCLALNSAAGSQPPKVLVTSSDRQLNSTSISVTCSTLCCRSLEHQPKNDHFRQHAEYLLVRNALSRRATCLTFNTAAGSQPIETMLMSFENPLNSTSGSAVKLGQSNFLIFCTL